ncbi:sensor histidine kinase [Thalassobellus suaedae]|uniref:histidine kinase n=1 Tax=Thalassobellus suaedae TaxID=3074124 RepID=A0ABY9XXB1_9FLAO|nr:PAS domain-containing sensor histidine kinase [Flavobacteriaceae bacterium HL-DH14]
MKDFQQIDTGGDIFKQIFKLTVIPILVHDMEMNIMNANDSAVEQFGFSRNELLNMSILDLHVVEELGHSNEVLKKMEHEMKLSVETSFKRKDGSIFIAEATPCRFMLRDIPLVHVFIQDITQRKQEQKQLQEINSALENEIAKVKRYSKEIILKNKELEDFSYVAAHDLKAPITNLSLIMDMINTDTITDQLRIELFGQLEKSIVQLQKTVFSLNDVINFKTTLKDKKIRLQFDEIFSEIKEGINEKLNKAEAIINVDFSECPEIDYPSLHLKSIMQNLLTNAVKYKDPDKALKIEVKTTMHNKRVCLKVKDNGLGFDSEKYKEKVFGLFKRLHNHVEGAGVGMYIVKSIIDTHGGKIEVTSQPKKGAMFNVYLNNETI